MRLLFGTLVAVLLVTMVQPAARAQGKTMNASGTVSAVSPASLTVKSKTEEWTFTIDKDTVVTAKGATHKSLALKAGGKETMLTDFVKSGDTVSVAYHDMGKMKHAATINVTFSAAK